MSERAAGSIPAPVSAEVLSGIPFWEALRHTARTRTHLPVGDPLVAALRRVEGSPALMQSRLLTRVLSALTYDLGDFRRAELAAFDAQTLAIVISLMDVHAAGTLAREEWVRATDAAIAAQHSAEA